MTTLNIISEEVDEYDECDNMSFYVSSDEFSEDEPEINKVEVKFSETEYERIVKLAKKCEEKLESKPLKFNGYKDINTYYAKNVPDSKNSMTTEFKKVSILKKLFRNYFIS